MFHFAVLRDEENESKEPHGLEIEFIKVLSKLLNFTYHFIDCHSVWGNLLPNNTWTGIIGELVGNVCEYLQWTEIENIVPCLESRHRYFRAICKLWKVQGYPLLLSVCNRFGDIHNIVAKDFEKHFIHLQSIWTNGLVFSYDFGPDICLNPNHISIFYSPCTFWKWENLVEFYRNIIRSKPNEIKESTFQWYVPLFGNYYFKLDAFLCSNKRNLLEYIIFIYDKTRSFWNN